MFFFRVKQVVKPIVKLKHPVTNIITFLELLYKNKPNSAAGQVGYAYVSAYCAAKHGVTGLTKSLALEMAKKGVTVNAVCPGYTETDIVRESIERVVAKTGRSAEEARAEFVKSNPQGRLVQPTQVADAVVWLCGDGASAVTGQSISVAGGEVM